MERKSAGREVKEMIKVAALIIAICEVVRAVQNAIQLHAIRADASARDNAYEEFVKSLKQTDREFVKRMLEEFEREDGES